MSTHNPRGFRPRSRKSRYAENAAVGGIVGVLGLLWIALWVAIAAAPLVIVALVLHFLGAF